MLNILTRFKTRNYTKIQLFKIEYREKEVVSSMVPLFQEDKKLFTMIDDLACYIDFYYETELQDLKEGSSSNDILIVWVDFNYQKYKKTGRRGSYTKNCILNDDYATQLINNICDYIFKNFDLKNIL